MKTVNLQNRVKARTPILQFPSTAGPLIGSARVKAQSFMRHPICTNWAWRSLDGLILENTFDSVAKISRLSPYWQKRIRGRAGNLLGACFEVLARRPILQERLNFHRKTHLEARFIPGHSFTSSIKKSTGQFCDGLIAVHHPENRSLEILEIFEMKSLANIESESLQFQLQYALGRILRTPRAWYFEDQHWQQVKPFFSRPTPLSPHRVSVVLAHDTSLDSDKVNPFSVLRVDFPRQFLIHHIWDYLDLHPSPHSGGAVWPLEL